MVPYASGKQYFELSVFHKVDWMDRDPLTNQQVWYAVTIVNRNGDEFRLVSPVKVSFFFNGVYHSHVYHRIVSLTSL